MKKFASISLIVLAIILAPAIAAAQSAEDQEAAYQAWAEDFLSSLTRLQGTIALPGAEASLNVPEGFYYLSPEDTARVLVEAWGNPPETSQTLGMLFPAGRTPLDDDSWGVTVEYQEDGYVTDEDAETLNYGELLSEMQADTAAGNEARADAGYEPIELVGWAEQPYYDKANNRLYWAKELHFGDLDFNTLNYDIRILGRKGVLVLSFVATMDQLGQIKPRIPTVLGMAQFSEGFTYADFNPDIDQVAAYGIGALVAGKVLSKAGFFGAALLIFKKFWIYILIGLGALGGGLMKAIRGH